MSQVDDGELAALRRRAYGRQADIHLDPESLERLRELEAPVIDEESRTEDEQIVPAPIVYAEPIDAPAVRPTPRWLPWVTRVGVWLLGVRRSTVFIVLGFALALAAIAATLVLVERVQPDPLQVGADQIARLSMDSGYRVPDFFGGPNESGDVQGYQEFHGLRMVISSSDYVYNAGTGVCLAIYPEMNIVDSTANSFSGQLFTGCAAGDFPAMVQFDVDIDGLPPELPSAFPRSTSLQFVYDEEHNEVVVFSDR